MKTIIILITAFSFLGCIDTKTPDVPGLNPSVVSDTWEYVNPDGACGASKLFGESDTYAFNCIHYIQVTRFADGAAYFTVNVGPTSYPYDYTWSEFLPPGITNFQKSIHLGASGNFQISGNMGRRVPSIFLNFSHNPVFTDAAAQSFTLRQVNVSQ